MNHSIKLLILGLVCFSSLCFGQKESVKINLENLENDFQKTEETMSDIIDSLILIIENKNLKREERRSAIFLLGKIKNDKSIHYLLEHLDVYLVKGFTLSDDDQAQEYPFKYILAQEYKADLTLVSYIFEYLKNLKKEVSQTKLIFLSSVLSTTCGESLAKEIVKHYRFNSNPTEIGRSNVKKFKTMFK